MKTHLYLLMTVALIVLGCQAQKSGDTDDLDIQREEEYQGNDTNEVRPIP